MSSGQTIRKIAIFSFSILFLTTGFFCFAGVLNPEEAIKDQARIELEENDAKMMMLGLVQKVSNKWVEIVASPDMKIEDELVMAIIGKAIRADVANYLFVDVPQQVGKEVVKASVNVAKLLLLDDPSGVIKEIEKLSVEESKRYAFNWFYQNQIKVNSGELPLSYRDIEGNWQNFTLPYIIAFKKLDDKRASVSIGIYSSKTVKAPHPVKNIPWEGGLTELNPFILKATGLVEENFGTYRWIGTPQIKTVFNEPVPEFSFPKEEWWDKVKDYLIELIPDFGFLGADIGKELRSLGETEDNPSSDINFNNIIDNGEKEEPTSQITEKEDIEVIVKPEVPVETRQMTIEEIQQALDDIAKEIDDLSKRIQEYAENNGLSEEKKEDSDKDKDKNKKKTEKTKTETEAKTKTIQTYTTGGGGSTTITPPSYCEKSLESESLTDKVIINEIAWMGTDASSNNEWIELKNITEEEISLSGWQLLDQGKHIKIIFSAQDIIPAQGFYLLERTDDESVPDITADYIYTGSLNDSEEALYLFNSGCQVEDEVSANPDWEAGDRDEKRTMERGSNLTWHTYSGDGTNGILGTPFAENSEDKQEIPIEITFNNSPWPMSRQNLQRNGQGLYEGPLSQPTIQWVYSGDGESDYDSIYTSPIIDDNGVIYTSIISPLNKKGILSLNSDGSKKEFEEKDITSPLMGKGNEIIADDKLSQAEGEDGSYYYSAGNILFAFDKDSILKWQRTFEKSEEACSKANPYLGNPIMGKDGMIYVAVKDKDCNSNGDRVDFLYIISPENGIILEADAMGFGTSSLSISLDGTVYLINAYYGKYSVGSNGEFKAFLLEEVKWKYELWKDIPSSPYSLPIIDSSGNVFFIYDKMLFGFDKDGNKIWELPIADISPNNWNTVDIGMALSSDGTIYIAGKGIIIAIK